MGSYRHTQFGWVISGALLVAGGALFSISLRAPAEAKHFLLAGAFLIFLFLLFFHSLTVEITKTHLKVWFGIGLIRRNIPLQNIRHCEEKRNMLILGWGIRFWWKFVLWNVSGFDAVEITLKGKSWKFRIGTDEPKALCEAIRKAISSGA